MMTVDGDESDDNKNEYEAFSKEKNEYEDEHDHNEESHENF